MDPAATFSGEVLGGLLGATHALTGVGVGELEEWSERLLSHPPPGAAGRPSRSDLNVNGSPLQVLVSSRARTVAHRLIGDPAFFHAAALARVHDSLRALDRVLGSGSPPALRAPAWNTLFAMLPRDTQRLRAYPHGVLRLARAVGSPGAAVYVGAPQGTATAWQAARGWLARMSATGWQGHLDALEAAGTLFGVGLEGRSPTDLRAKLYWRAAEAVPLADLGVAPLGAPEVAAFLRSALGGREIAARGLTFSAAYDLCGGGLRDAKVDVCTRSAGLDDAAAVALAERMAALHGLALPPLRALLENRSLGLGVACVGFGLGRTGHPRLNVYLYQAEPRSLPGVAAARAASRAPEPPATPDGYASCR
jgi:hypothetical protein